MRKLLLLLALPFIGACYGPYYGRPYGYAYYPHYHYHHHRYWR